MINKNNYQDVIEGTNKANGKFTNTRNITIKQELICKNG